MLLLPSGYISVCSDLKSILPASVAWAANTLLLSNQAWDLLGIRRSQRGVGFGVEVETWWKREMMAEGATGELALVPQEFYFTQQIIWLTDFFLYISSSPVHQHRLLLFFRLGAGGWVGGGVVVFQDPEVRQRLFDQCDPTTTLNRTAATSVASLQELNPSEVNCPTLPKIWSLLNF